MGDMDALPPEFARGILRQPAESELAHGNAAKCGYPIGWERMFRAIVEVIGVG
jgi:hypothetical protein